MLTYSYYAIDYGGTKVESQDFPRYLKKAVNYLDYITFYKDLTTLSESVNDKVNFVLCEVIDVLKDYDDKVKALNVSQLNLLGEGIKSESIKSHSVTFQDVKGSEQSDMLKGVEDIIYSMFRTSLLPTGLLSRVL